MAIKNYDQLSSLELDTLKEIGSIGTGNAATSLSALIGMPVRIQTPEVRIMGYNEAIEWIGGPERSPPACWWAWTDRSAASCSPCSSWNL